METNQKNPIPEKTAVRPVSRGEDLVILDQAENLVRNFEPFLTREGSSIRVKDCQKGVLTLVLNGACVGCSLLGNDLPDFVQSLKEGIPRLVDVKFLDSLGYPLN